VTSSNEFCQFPLSLPTARRHNSEILQDTSINPKRQTIVKMHSIYSWYAHRITRLLSHLLALTNPSNKKERWWKYLVRNILSSIQRPLLCFLQAFGYNTCILSFQFLYLLWKSRLLQPLPHIPTPQCCVQRKQKMEHWFGSLASTRQTHRRMTLNPAGS
jgi:hypothetical protein